MADALEIQALWFAVAAFDLADADAWCTEHDYAPVDWRERDEDGEVTHHIAVLVQPDAFDPDSFVTLADDFPEGVSATLGRRKSMPKKPAPGKTVTIVGHQSKSDPMTFVMSDETIDRMEDVIEAKGWKLSNFRKNNIALFNHDYDKVIGSWKNVRVENDRLVGDLVLAAEGTSPLVDEIRTLVEQRILKAVSVGFRPLKYEWLKDDDGDETGGIRFREQELLECSVVSVPANPSALAVARSFGISAETRALIFGKPGAPGGKGPSGAREPAPLRGDPPRARKGSNGINPGTGGRTMSIAEKIIAKEERLVAIKDRLTEINALVDADPDHEFSEAEDAEISALSDEQESVLRSIESLRKIEAGLASKAQPAPRPAAPGASKRPPAAAARKESGGSLLVKSMAAAVIGHMTQRGTQEVLAEMYGDDDRVLAASKIYVGTRKSATALADTTTPGWAAELVQNDMRGFLTDLRARSIYAQLVNTAGAQSLDFGGANSITIPRRNVAGQSTGAATAGAAAAHLGAQMGGAWVGEGGVIPVKQMVLASQTLNRYKLATISAFTNELLDQSTPSIEAIIRNAILEDTALAVDGGLLDGVAAVAGVRPASILNGVTPTASAGATAADVITDLRVLLDAMSAINGSSPVLIMNTSRLLGLATVQTVAGGFMFRDEIASGRLLGVPVLSSTTVNPAYVVMVDAGSFVGANDAPQFYVSDQATLTMANSDGTAPTQAEDGTGALGDPEQVPPDGGIYVAGGVAAAGAAGAGYSAMSLYQQYSTAVRMVLPSAWGLVRPGSVAALSGVAW